MKRFFTLSPFLFLLIAFFSCVKPENATEDFYTTLSAEIPVTVVDTTMTADSVLVFNSFSDTITESLENHEGVKDYLDLIKRIECNEVNIEFNGLLGNQIIEKADVYVEGIGIIATIENINPSNYIFTPDVNSSVLIQIAYLLYLDKQLTVIVSGTTNQAPMNFITNIYFDLHIEASPL
ncbi:MAG TPA: hypothetical protein PK335_14065 [Draconibacterium sp.]|nr:hypothetical protein [Draconibacterium sp.]